MRIKKEWLQSLSVHTRLTAWYTGAIWVVLMLAALFLYWSSLHLLHKADYEFLSDEVETLQYIVKNRSLLTSLLARAQQRMNASTNLVNADAENEITIKMAKADAEAIQIRAIANTEAAAKLETISLAGDLARFDKYAVIARAMGKGTTFMPHDLAISVGQNPMGLFFKPPQTIEQSNQSQLRVVNGQ